MGSLLKEDDSCNLIHMTKLAVFNEERHIRNSGLICTIGPASRSVPMLVSLIEAGLNIARMNFSHGSHDYHAETIANVRQAAETARPFGNKRPVGIALDTKGPEIRTGNLKGAGEGYKEVKLTAGQEIIVSVNKDHYAECSDKVIYVDYANIVNIMEVGQLIYIDDGLLSLKVKQKKDAQSLLCDVMNGGALGSHKGVNLPHSNVDLPALSERDISDIKFGLEQKIDMIFASFIRKAADVQSIRALLGEEGKHIKVISKIENKEGIDNVDEIIEASDGVMVARGDMGIEIPPEKVFLAQKMITAKCNLAGKPVICATQMLESMTVNPRPTRAEASDVANAVLDGSDCVMLSGETAKGKYPLEAVKIMSNICREAEAAWFSSQYFFDIRRFGNAGLGALSPSTSVNRIIAEGTCIAAVDASFAMNCSCIIVLTTTGTTAKVMSRYRPLAPILVVTRNAVVAAQIHLWRGCFPIHYPEPREAEMPWMEDVDRRVRFAVAAGRSMGIVHNGSAVAVVTGWKTGAGSTNTLRILTVDEKGDFINKYGSS